MASARPQTLLVLAGCLGAIAATGTLPATAAADACPNANLTPQPGNLPQIRAAVLCLIDQEREDHGESTLQSNPRLVRPAQNHSEEMASRDYFAHVGPSGDTPLARMRASGYVNSSRVGYTVGENIAWGTLWLATPNAIVNAWMASPGHRANILNARYRDTGIGVSPRPPASMAEGQEGAIYTQDFGAIIATGRASRHSPALAGRITSGAQTSEGSNRNHGSSRRQVRHRHRVRARHRARHRRAAHRRGRAGAHQRSRRRHRRAGLQ